MCKINEKNWILYAVTGASFLRFPLSRYGYELYSGLILVADNDSHAKEIERGMVRSLKAVSITRWNNKAERPENFRIVIHRYRKSDTTENLENFLAEEDFLPIVIVGGVIPEALREKGYALKATFGIKEIVIFARDYSKFQEFVIKEIGYISQELRVLKMSKKILEYRKEGASSFKCYMFAVGKMWWCSLLEKRREEEMSQWMDTFIKFTETSEGDIERLDNLYSVKTAVRECIIQFILEKDISVVDIHNCVNSENQCIYTDGEYYFLSEALMKNMCAPLLETVSFVQLKHEMEAEGILVTNRVRGNYTVKILLYDAATRQMQRRRFLKVNKKDFINDEGIYLENLCEVYSQDKEDFAE